MKKQKIELTPKQKKKKNILRILLFIFLYFTVFKFAKLQFDKAIIITMPFASSNHKPEFSDFSKAITVLKARFISRENINIHVKYTRFPLEILCLDNPKAMEIVANKGGTFNISYIDWAYRCLDISSVKFLEEWIAIDKYSQDDLSIANDVLGISVVNVAPFKLLLDTHPELKQYDELRQIILLKLKESKESLDATSYDNEEYLEKYQNYQEALAYFDS